MFWIRSTLSSGDCTEPSKQPVAFAAIYYEKADTAAAPGNNSVAHVDTSDPCSNDDLAVTVPSYKITPGNPATTFEIEVKFAVNETKHLTWTIDNSTYRGDLGNPLLLLTKTGNSSLQYKPEWNVRDVGSNSSVRVIINNKSPTSHPWHFHAHEM